MRTFNFDDGACSDHSMVGTTQQNCCSKLITNNQRNKKYHSSQHKKHFLLQHNQNRYLSNIHYKRTSPHLPVCQGILKNVLSLCLILLIVCVRESVCTYLNQVAVHIEGGLSKANEVASKHGFINTGQIGKLTDKYLFEHPRISKRSVSPNSDHVKKLADDSDILWFEQQFAKKRTKRDLIQTITFDDPLYKKEWYLHGGGHGGFDMNVVPAWKEGYTGKGVVISILDDGIEKDHPDLAKNYDPEASYDVNGKDSDPTPRYDPTNENRHGTRCAGEVSALGNNSVCGVGIAYDSKIGGVRMLDGFVTDSVEASALGLNSQHIDIYSASWGPDDNGRVVDGPGPLATQAFVEGIELGRNGLGNIFVWASGNGGSAYDSCNCDGYTNSIYTLSVSSTSKNGMKPWYLEECASTIASTYSSGSFGEPQVVTVDLRGKCTTSHTGTSASAPLAAGIVALALQANDKLTWRDVQYITVLTARPEPMVDGEWSKNGLGRNVSLRYGYGLMDAAAMVKMAKVWTTLPDKHICEIISKDVQSEIPSRVVYKSILHVDGCQGTGNVVKYLEHVQAQLTIQYSRRGDLRITLTSPNGTRSTLLPPRPNDWQAGGFDKWPFLSVHFWGENPQGTWVLEIENEREPEFHDNVGGLVGWTLILHGTEEYPIKLKDTKSSHDQSNDHIYNGIVETVSMSSDSTVNQPNSTTPVNKSSIVCHEQCANDCYGTSASECHACKHFRNGPKGPCVAACPAAYYGNPETNECHPCDSSCQACSGPLTTHCQLCKDGYHLIANNTCSKICRGGFFMDQKEKRCKSCQTPCSSCEFNAKNCTGCLKGHKLTNGQCIKDSNCASDEYQVEGSCISCFHLCATCNGPSSTQCSSCQANFLINNGSCTPASCSAGFYQDINGGSNSPICKRCHKSCLMCYGPASFQCVTCRPTYKMLKNECVEDNLQNSCNGNELCLNRTKKKPSQEETERTLIILPVLFSIFTLILIAAAAIIYYAQSNNKLCWAYRYQKVVVLFDENTNRFLLTNGDSGDEDEEKFEIK